MSLDKKWKAILDPRLLICVFLGFSSGLPLFILLTLLQAWLTKSGLSIKSLGLFALVMFPYTWKFLWAPLMDRYSFPLLGRRRGWMALTQILLFFCIGFLYRTSGRSSSIPSPTPIAMAAAVTNASSIRAAPEM